MCLLLGSFILRLQLYLPAKVVEHASAECKSRTKLIELQFAGHKPRSAETAP